MEESRFHPDYIVVPMQLIDDKNLTSIDQLVYGVVYFASRLKMGKCIASNAMIGRTLNVSPTSVGNALTKLEKYRYIHRVFDDEKKKFRKEIIPLVTFGRIDIKDVRRVSSIDDTVSSIDVTPYHPQMIPVSSIDEHSSNSNKEESKGELVDSSIDDTPEIKKPMVDEAISWFLPLFPGEFADRSAYAKPPTRKAVTNAIKAYGQPALKKMIIEFTKRRHEKFAPTAGSIYDFCTFKLAKIEQFVNKSTRPDSPAFGDFRATGEFKSEEERQLAESIKNKIKSKRI